MTAFCVALAAGLAACGSSDTGNMNPTGTGLTGTWSYSASAVSGDTVSCSVAGATLALTQTGSTFTGTYSGAQLSCTVNGKNYAFTKSGNVTNGTINGQDVSFNFDSATITNTGTVNSGFTSMSGMATATQLGVTVTGPWMANKTN